MNRSALLRLGIGILISVVFLGATLSQVDLAKVARTITDASLPLATGAWWSLMTRDVCDSARRVQTCS